MHLPSLLKSAIDHELRAFKQSAISASREELSARYRQQKGEKSFMTSKEQRASYLATRMPATYAAVFKALAQIKEVAPDLSLSSMLDLGAGPGTAMWAALEHFPELAKITCLENDAELISIGQRLAKGHENLSLAQWQQVDLEQKCEFPTHDMVILSYSLNEIHSEKLLTQAITATKKMIVIVEPGTPVGFERIRAARTFLLENNYHILAPCPHENNCPMSGSNWCHFSARLERSAAHRQIKGGTLGHEDEKFSFIAAARTPISLPIGRILRHPQKRVGHIHLEVCAQNGLISLTKSKKDGEQYKKARKLEWGDCLPFKP